MLCRVPLLGGSPQTLVLDLRSIAFSPDGSKIAFARNTPQSGTLWVSEADGSQQRQIGESFEARPYFTFTWSSDGREIVYVEGARTPTGSVWTLWAAAIKTGGTRKLTQLTQPVGALALASRRIGIYCQFSRS